MLFQPQVRKDACGDHGSHDECQNDRLPNVALAGISGLQLFPVVHPFSALGHKGIEQNQKDHSADHRVGAKAPLDAETGIVEQSVTCRCGFKLENGIF